MKFCVSLLLLLLFDTLQGSTLPHVRKVRGLNTTLQTNFNGTYERRNPCTNAEIETSSYVASHEFRHHTSEENWSDYTHKCSAIISGFLQAIGNLVRFNNKQNGLFNFHINTSISQKQIGSHKVGKCCEPMPTILIEATDCELIPKKRQNVVKEAEEVVTEGKYDGPVCLLNKSNKAGPRTVSGTASYEQNADKCRMQTPLPEPEPQIIPTTSSYECLQPKLENSSGFQATAPENANEQRNFNPPAAIPQPSFIGIRIPPQSVVSPNNEELINQNQFPPALPNEQGLPAVYPQQLSNDNLDGSMPREPLTSSYPKQTPEFLPPSQSQDSPQEGPQNSPNFQPTYNSQNPNFELSGNYLPPPEQTQDNFQGGPDYPETSPAFQPTYNDQTPNLEFSATYPPPTEQAPLMESSSELPPTDYNNTPFEAEFTTQAQQVEETSDMAQTVENNFTPDQQQTITPQNIDTVYDDGEPMNYNQVPTTLPLQTQPEFLPAESQQQFPDYPSEIATNEQLPMNSVETLPPDSVGPQDAAFSDSPVIPSGGVGSASNLPVENTFQPLTPSNSQPPTAPILSAPQPYVQQSMIPPPVESNISVQEQQPTNPEFQIPLSQTPESREISYNPPIDSFPNQPEPNTSFQPLPEGYISPSNDFPEQLRDTFDTPDSTGFTPVENTTPQPIATSEPQPSPDFTGQLQQNEMYGAEPQNFENTVPADIAPVQSSTVVPSTVAQTSDNIPQTPVEDSQFDYPTSAEEPEPSVSGLVPNIIGNQLSELTYDNAASNSNDFQPETQSYFTEPSDRNLDYTAQTPFYDTIPATYKSEPESQPDLNPDVQNLPESPITPAPEQAFPPYGLESSPTTTLSPELPPLTPDVTKTESDSEQTSTEFDSTPAYPDFVNPPRNDFQTVEPTPGPQFMAPEQTFGDDRYPFAMQQPNLTPETSNPLNTDQPPLDNNPDVPVQQQPQFYPTQNGDFQQPLPETPFTSQPSPQTPTQQEYQTTDSETNEFSTMTPVQDQPTTPAYPQPPMQSDVPDYPTQPDNQLPNASDYYPEGRVSDQFYPDSTPQNENQPFQAAPQSDLPYQAPNVQIPSAESQGQFINPETTSAESTPDTQYEPNNVGMTDYQSNITPAAPEAGGSFPEYPSVEEQSAGFDGYQMPQQDYPNSGFPSGQELPVDLPTTQAPEPQSLSVEQSAGFDGYQMPQQNYPSAEYPSRQELPADIPTTQAPESESLSVEQSAGFDGYQMPQQNYPNAEYPSRQELPADIPTTQAPESESLSVEQSAGFDGYQMPQQDYPNSGFPSGQELPADIPTTQAPESESLSVEQQSAGLDGYQMPQQNYPNAEYPSRQELPADIPTTQAPESESLSVEQQSAGFGGYPMPQQNYPSAEYPSRQELPADIPTTQAAVPESFSEDQQSAGFDGYQMPQQDYPNGEYPSQQELPADIPTTQAPESESLSVEQSAGFDGYQMPQQNYPNAEYPSRQELPVDLPTTQAPVPQSFSEDQQSAGFDGYQMPQQNYPNGEYPSQQELPADIPTTQAAVPESFSDQQSAGFDGYQMPQQNYPNGEYPSRQELPADIPTTQAAVPESFSDQQSAGFDGYQMPQQNYPNAEYPSRQELPVDLPTTQAPVPESFSEQSDSNLNYDGVQPSGLLQPQPQMPGNDEFSLQTNSNSQSIAFPPQTGPVNPQNGINPNELQTFAPSASSQQTGATPFPLSPLQTVPENSQVDNFSQGSAFASTVSATPGVLDRGMDNLMLNPDQPSGVSQQDRQDLNTNDQFSTAVPPQFATQSSGEATTDYQEPYQAQPSEDYFSGVPGVQTANQLTSIDAYQPPAPTTQAPLDYFQERPDDVAQTTPPPFQADQFLTSSQSQSEYVQNNAAMYSPNLAPRPQPQPSFDNLTEFPGDKTAGSTTQTPLPSEIKPETFGSQPLRQTALTETNIPDTDNTKTLDTQPKSGSLNYLGPQIYPNFDVPAPAVNYPRQDRRSFPPTADSITRDMTYQTTNPAFTPSQTVPTFGINPIEMVFNTNSSYFSTAMTPSEGLETQPFRQASALIASPQPQSTTVKYNEQIIIPQYQTPTASNPQPQATLKYADQYSGDNTKEGLLDSAAWTSSGPQEAMGTIPSTQYQTTPLRFQFAPSNIVVESTGWPFPAQKQPFPVTQSFVTPTPPSEQQENYSQGKTTTKITEETITTDAPVDVASSSVEDQLAYNDKLLNSSTPEYGQTVDENRQSQRQQIEVSPTETTEVASEYLVAAPTPPPMEIQNQLQIESSSLTNTGEVKTDTPMSIPIQFEQDVKVQPHPQLQSFPTTNVEEIMDDSPVIAPTPIEQQIDVQQQIDIQPFSSQTSGEVVTDSLVTQPPPVQQENEDQPQLQLEELDSANIRGVVAEGPVFTPPQIPRQFVVQPQIGLQYPTVIMREGVTAGTVNPPPSFQQQTDVQPQPQLESSSTNTTEIISNDSPINSLTPAEQQTDVQQQTDIQPFSSEISREVVTDSLVTQPPFPQQFVVQPQIGLQYPSIIMREGINALPVNPPPPFLQQTDVQPEPEVQSFSSTNTTEITDDSPVNPPTPLEQQPDVQPQTDLQPFSSETSREVVTDSLVSQVPSFPQQFVVQPQFGLQYPTVIMREGINALPVNPQPTFQQQTEVQGQSQLQSFPSTNTTEIIDDTPVNPPIPLEQQIDVQPQTDRPTFSSEISREVVTDSFVTQPPTFEPQIEDQPQPQLEELDATNIGEDIPDRPVTQPPPLQEDTEVQPQPKLEETDSTIIREGVTETPVIPPVPFPQQIFVQPQIGLQYSPIIMREGITAGPVNPPRPFQQQTAVQPEPQLQSFPSTNTTEIIDDAPVNPPIPLEQQIDVQQQTDRDVVTDSFVTQPPPFPQQFVVQPQIGLQYPTVIMREGMTGLPVNPPPPFQEQPELQPEPEVQSFSSTNTTEIIDNSPINPATPIEQQINVQQLQPFSSTISREIASDSLVSQPSPVQPQIEDESQHHLEELDSTNVKEDTIVPPVTRPPPLQQEIEIQSQPQLQQFPQQFVVQPQFGFQYSPIIMREGLTVGPVNSPSPFLQQTDVQTEPEVQSFSSTNTTEVIADSPVMSSPPVEQQIDVQQQTDIRPISSEISREMVTDSFVTQPPPFPQQFVVQPQIGLQYPPIFMREGITALPVNAPPPFQEQTEVQPQPQLEELDSTNVMEVMANTTVTPPPPIEQQIDVQPQTESQPFSSTMSTEMVTDSLQSPPSPVEPQIEVQSQPQVEDFYNTNIREDIATPLVNPPSPFQQQIFVQPQIGLQYPTIITSEGINAPPVNPPPLPFQQPTQVQPQPQLQSFSSTNTTEVIPNDSPVMPSAPLEQQTDVEPQNDNQQFSSEMSRDVVTDSFVTQPSPFPQQFVVQPQIGLEYSPIIMREGMTSLPVNPPPPFLQQTDVQPEPEVQSFSSTNTTEIIDDSPVNTATLVEQQTDVEPQTDIEPFSSEISREVVTDSFVTQPSPFPQQFVVQPQIGLQYTPIIMREGINTFPANPPRPFEPQIEVQPQPQPEGFDAANITEVVTEASVIPPTAIEQQIDVQPETDIQQFPSEISREIVTDSLVTQPPPFEPQIEDQANLEGFDSANIMEDVTEPPVIPPVEQQTDVQQQTQPQAFSSEISGEVVIDSLVSQPPPFQQENEDQPQPQLEELDSENIRELVSEPPVITPAQFPQQIFVQPQVGLGYPTIIMREGINVLPVNPPAAFQQQTDLQPEPQLQSFSSTNTTEIISNDSPIIAPTPIEQQIDVQPQTDIEPFSSEISREVVTDSVVTQPPPLQQENEEETQPQLEELDSTNIREDVTEPSVITPPQFPQQIFVQPQIGVGYPTIIMREGINALPVNPPPPFEPQIVEQPQANFQGFDSANVTEVVTESPVIPPMEEQIAVQQQTRPQPFSSTISVDSVVSQPPPLQQENEDEPQPQLEELASTNISEDVSEPPLITPPQQIFVQPQVGLGYPTIIMREGMTGLPVNPPPPFQEQTELQPEPEVQSFSSTNMREIIDDSSVNPPTPMEQQIDVQQLQPFSSTISREIASDSFVTQPPPFEAQIEVQSEPQLVTISSSNMGDIITDSVISPPLPVEQPMERQPQPELQSFSSTNSTDFYVNPPTQFQQDVETQPESELQNFSSRNTTKTMSDDLVGASASPQGAGGQVFSTGNSGEVAAKLEKHIAREYQTQRTRYTTSNTKEVITETFLPTSESIYVESGKDGQLKIVEIRSDSKENPSNDKRTTEVVEEIIASDFPDVTEFSSLEDEFIFADKLLNNSKPILKTTSFIKVSPLGENTNEKVVSEAVEIEKPADQISINSTTENGVSLSKPTLVNYDQAPIESDEVVASNLNSQTTSQGADRQSIFKSGLRPPYGPEYQSRPTNWPATVSSLRSDQPVSPDFQTSRRKVLLVPIRAPDNQGSSHLNPLLQTLETHLHFPLREPPEQPFSQPGPPRQSPLPLLNQSDIQLRPNSPIKTRRWNSEPDLVKFQNSGEADQKTNTAPQPDLPVPVPNPTDPSNGPDPLRVLKTFSLDRMLGPSNSENF